MRARITTCGFALAVLLFAGCASSTLGRGTPSRAERQAEKIARLEREKLELEQRAVMAEVEVKRLQRELAEKERAGVVEPAADNLDGGPSTVSEAPGSEQETAVPMVPASVEVSELPDPAADLEPVPSPSPPNGVSGETLTEAAQALYDRGYTLYHQGQYVDSETAFRRFLQRFSSTVLGDNAQFWIAEARYARGDIEGAIAAYRETVSRFPGGNKVPDAGLKIGDCLRDLGDTEGARRAYRKVIDEHPGSVAAAVASERLAN